MEIFSFLFAPCFEYIKFLLVFQLYQTLFGCILEYYNYKSFERFEINLKKLIREIVKKRQIMYTHVAKINRLKYFCFNVII